MYAQVTTFDGPRSAELVAAADVANRERIMPVLSQDAELQQGLALNLILRRPDGAEMVITVARSTETLHRGEELILGTTLLPGEDPLLLPGPSRVETWSVVDVVPGGATADLLDARVGASGVR
ncbi:MAG: hypothetical protein AVDCRST_MAG48-3430 [uncultured Friedmanniella sp.]|uniref:Uncharacterized protein n=1 Tax=uncultured Friedmanniella sp. TaxID=335381 RepID=A0A6J4LMN5_9ACTN|nr:MAG: hypothetical protein AVDCRST_MAG48-3430 [uncultured Friedmanniella sp.]